MISTMAHSLFQSMNRFSFLLIALLVLPSADLFAQEAATGGAENSTPPATNQTSGLLTPPSDNATPAPTTTTTTTTTQSVKSSSAEPSPREIERVQQQAIIRRQELLFKANQAMESAQKAELADQYPVARQNYLFAAEAYGSISRATITYARAAEGLTRVDFRLYDNALQIGDTGRAKMLIDEVVHYNPNNKAALEKQVAINRALANPNDTSILGNHAINPAFVKQVNEVQQLFSEAEQFRRTGQWDEAEARLKRILGIDPYNITATKQLERIDAEKNQYAEAARLETRKERLDQVEQTWYEPITNRDLSTSAQEDQATLKESTHFSIDQQLKSITISLDFNNATIEEATNFLHVQSQQADPDHKGINFIILPKASETAKPISLTLNNVPLGEALRYISQIANVKYKVQDYAISVVPFNANLDDIILRTFNVQPSFVAPPMEAGTDSAAAASVTGRRPVPVAGGGASPIDASDGDTVRQALEAKGIKFLPGSSAVYSATTGQLTVQNTADQMELLEELVNAGQAPTLMVRISAKFVEINQEDVNDLTFNSAFNFNPLAPVALIGGVVGVPLQSNGHPVGQPATFSTSLAGAASFSANSIDQLLVPQSTSTNLFSVHGFVGAAEYNMIVQALSQKKSFDLLSEPFNMTKSGETGTLEAIRIFPYPIAFDPPELVSSTGAGNQLAVPTFPPTVIPTTPTDFKRRNVGVRLVSRPQISADDKTIDLSLVPEVTDFEGFINYGSQINVGNPDGTTSLLSTNLINQPVFDTRRINTKVQIRDGSTVVLGGLIREDVQKIDQKVPILGDIPLLGRLFQSKAMESKKRNLIVFITANIYRNNGELLNPPELSDAVNVLTGHPGIAPVAQP
jgi:general secretion pathway protein D